MTVLTQILISDWCIPITYGLISVLSENIIYGMQIHTQQKIINVTVI